MSEKMIIIYGTSWCSDCLWVRDYFDGNNIGYEWIDIDRDPAGEKFVLTTNRGLRSVPTICFEDGSILVEPTVSEIKKILQTIFPA